MHRIGSKRKVLKLTAFVCGAATIAFLINILVPLGESDSKIGEIFLGRPAFAQQSEISFLEEEAGIAAYVNVGQTIDLTRAKTAYRTIETETANYLIGSVALPDYDAGEDVHAYLHKDGWIVVYYMKDEPRSKIVDWLHYSVTNMQGTKLELGLSSIGNTLGISISNIQHYDFAYASANRLMIVADQESFKITIPSELAVYERSYSLYNGRTEDYTDIKHAKLTTELSSGITHTVWQPGNSLYIDDIGITSVSSSTSAAGVAIVIVYRE